jgi:hypothetical protein
MRLPTLLRWLLLLGAASAPTAQVVIQLRHAPRGRVLVPADTPTVHPQLQQVGPRHPFPLPSTPP